MRGSHDPLIEWGYPENMKLLVVEDETAAGIFLQEGLSEEGYAVDMARDAHEADEAVALYRYDLIVLDVMLPGKDGFTLCRQWRMEGVKSPILFLTARDDVADRIVGLDQGGDDYLVKPFAFDELLARIRALLRRTLSEPVPPILTFGELVIDTNSKKVWRHGELVSLTAREHQMLEYLAFHPERLITRTKLWEHVWETGSEPDSNVVDVYIGYLRQKLGRERIETVRGQGYRFKREVADE
jgi:two-component system, OmpR family, response regulator